MSQRTDNGQLWDDFILVERSPSHVWFCSYLDRSIKVAYIASSPYPHPEAADDLVATVEPYQQLIDCL